MSSTKQGDLFSPPISMLNSPAFRPDPTDLDAFRLAQKNALARIMNLKAEIDREIKTDKFWSDVLKFTESHWHLHRLDLLTKEKQRMTTRTGICESARMNTIIGSLGTQGKPLPGRAARRAVAAVSGALLAVTSFASDLAIQSFDATGRLTFNELTTATVYRVDWAPAPDGPWHTGSPGATGIVARGWGQNAATVGLAQTACFFRVVAQVTNAAPPATSGDYLVVDLSGGTNAPSYPVSYFSTLANVPGGASNDLYKTTKLLLRLVTNGVFTMGSPPAELGREPDEVQHLVTLSQGYYVGVYEVTQKQWERITGTWPSFYTNALCRETRPVDNVCYEYIRGSVGGTNWPANVQVDGTSFMGRLRFKTGKLFDLPTEAQWEYACRAGTATALNSGLNLTGTNNCPNMSAVGRYWFNGGSTTNQAVDTAGATAKVGSYLPNAFGLYDMHGNVWELCLDWTDAYPGATTDPKGATTGTRRVLRGGPWNRPAWYCRSGNRYDIRPFDPSTHVGLRVVLPVAP